MAKIDAHPTPASIAVYIGSYHVDDAFSVEWTLRNTSEPIFQYFLPHWTEVAPGKFVVIGSLSLNFRFPGYLFKAVEEASSTAWLKKDDESKLGEPSADGWYADFLNTMRRGNADQRMAAMLQAAIRGPGDLRKASRLAQAVVDASTAGSGRIHPMPNVFDAQLMPDRVLPVDIWIHYGPLTESHAYRVIRDAVFTGENEQAQAGASAAGGLSSSGVNLLDVYSFFARKVEGGIIDPV